MSDPKRLVFAACLALCVGAAQAEETPYTVSKIAVDVTAKNAVAAKANAMAEAEKRGLNTVLRRIVPFSFYPKLPELQPEQIEGTVNSISIRKEQYSTTRYIATLDVIFNEEAVKQLVTSLGVPTSEEQAPTISILPLVIEGNQVKSGVSDPWCQAWLNLDLTHGLTPATVLQPRPGLELGLVRAVLAGAPRWSSPSGRLKKAASSSPALLAAMASAASTTDGATNSRAPRQRPLRSRRPPSPMPSWRTAGRRRGRPQSKWPRCDMRRECRPQPRSKESRSAS
jgi:hypothetical protein